ncbi:MAG: DUF1579 domain-containing protein [Planctomycetota bacterium]|nr:DUF1579 domain-containing protein [Planctomycetota bacterium]
MKMKMFIGGLVAGCALSMLMAMAIMPNQDPADMDKMMQEVMEKYMAPSDEHAELAKRVGEWNTDLTMWNYPGAAPETMGGSCRYSMIMDGRYLFVEYKSEYMGMPFEGAGLTGYDRIKNQYQNLWVDNMGTSMAISEGTRKGDTITFTGDMPNPMMGNYVKSRSTEQTIDDDTFVMKMYMPGPDGEEFKSMEITYTRIVD